VNDLKIKLFYLNGDPPFIFEIYGKATIDILEEIEQNCIDNFEEIFNKGEGSYLFEVTREEGQISFPETGQWDFPPYWELNLIEYKAISINDSN
jgi:hypothetical protein